MECMEEGGYGCMQMWMVAMLAISGLLMVRDMAKFIFTDRKKGTPIYDTYPQKERMERYAKSFQKLAHTFYEMPSHQEQLTKQEIQSIFDEVKRQVCENCVRREICWQEEEFQTMQRAYTLLQAIEEENEDKKICLQGEAICNCKQIVHFTDQLEKQFLGARESLLYRNRLIENRLAVAEQLQEVSKIIQELAEDVTDLSTMSTVMEEKIRRHMQKQHVLVKQIWILEKADQRSRIFMKIRTRGGQCMTMREVARQLSEVCGCSFVPSQDSRAVLNSEFKTVLFVEDVNYKVLYGVARLTKDSELISGDNYVCTCMDEKFLMCLSDGMGSGMEACQESEIVVDLLEQFITSGFSREAAARMVNAALVLQRKNGMFSSVDVCTLDLYTGICEFLKAGAATTFIRRPETVEAVTSNSMAVGLVQRLDFEKTSKKLDDGDYLVMVTDGVLDALPKEQEEETMKRIILEAKEEMPKELGRCILEKVLSYSNYRAMDDMTVLVAGMWKK